MLRTPPIMLAALIAATVAGAQEAAAPLPPPRVPGAEDGLGRDPGPPPPDGPEAEAAARAEQLSALFEQLAQAEAAAAPEIEAQIWAQWNRSGSPAMDLLAARADGAIAAGALDDARVHLDALVRLAPEFAEGWNKRATLHFMREAYGESVADIERVLALEPRHFGALSGLGIILDRLGDKAGAMRAFRRVIELHPNAEGAAEGIESLSPDVDGRPL